MGKWINEHLIPKILAFVNTKAVQSIKDGMVYTMPLLIVGSIFLILIMFVVFVAQHPRHFVPTVGLRV